MHTSSSFPTHKIIHMANVSDIDGLGRKDSIRSSFDFIHKMGITWLAFHALKRYNLLTSFHKVSANQILNSLNQILSDWIQCFHPIFKAFLLFTLIYFLWAYCRTSAM